MRAISAAALCLLLLASAVDGSVPADPDKAGRPDAPLPSDLPEGEEPDLDPRLEKRGRFLYDMYCGDCHGPAARGDGPAAANLDPPPADLTLMSRRAGGDFPWLAAYEIIDGRSRISSHQLEGMPIWGLRFQELGNDSSQADEIRGRILQLLHYLRSIQAPGQEPDEP